MWHNHPFESKKQCNKKSKGNGQNMKKGVGWQYRGVFIKQGGQEPSANYDEWLNFSDKESTLNIHYFKWDAIKPR